MHGPETPGMAHALTSFTTPANRESSSKPSCKSGGLGLGAGGGVLALGERMLAFAPPALAFVVDVVIANVTPLAGAVGVELVRLMLAVAPLAFSVGGVGV